MRGNRLVTSFGISLIGAVALLVAVQAATVTNGGVTLTYPDYSVNGPALLSCEPSAVVGANSITLSGIPVGSSVVVQFAWASPVIGSSPTLAAPLNFVVSDTDPLVVPVSYPPESSQWPFYNPTTNERAIALAVAVRITTPAGGTIVLSSKKWWVRCLPPPAPKQGCTLGYWKQDHHFDSWVGYAPGDDFEAVFGVDASFDPHTLLDALWLGGGGERALARQATAALLSATYGLNYQFTVGEIIAGVQEAYATQTFEPFKDLLDAANNAGCPLD